MSIDRLLADAVAVLHAAYVLFVIFGQVAIVVGFLAGWSWVRNFWFRAVHLTMIAIVVVESLLQITCPLTTWEFSLRGRAGESVESVSFVGRWVHEILFWEFSPTVFTIIYCVFGACVLLTFLLVPPRRPTWLHRKKDQSGAVVGR